jgi:hypothetical protein
MNLIKYKAHYDYIYVSLPQRTVGGESIRLFGTGQ